MVLLVLFVTAGGILQDGASDDAHGIAAVAVHVTSGVTAGALGFAALRDRGLVGRAVLAAVVFAGTFGQAALGSYATLTIHIACALLLVVTSTWLTVWLIGSRAGAGEVRDPAAVSAGE